MPPVDLAHLLRPTLLIAAFFQDSAASQWAGNRNKHFCHLPPLPFRLLVLPVKIVGQLAEYGGVY